MPFVRLELLFHDHTLLEQVGESSHDDGIKHVYLQKEPISYVETVEWHTLDKGDSSDISDILIVLILPVAHGKRMVDRKM